MPLLEKKKQRKQRLSIRALARRAAPEEERRLAMAIDLLLAECVRQVIDRKGEPHDQRPK